MGMYVVSHKELKRRFPEKYRTIIVNANRNNVKGDLYDNTGDNISQKNGSYCELTAIYWLWKNSSDKFVGIDHYRRFFMDNKKNNITFLRYFLIALFFIFSYYLNTLTLYIICIQSNI